jgi:hypothetical protein
VKHELRLWLKAKLDSHTSKHQENKLKNLLKMKRILWETTKTQYMCAFAKVDALSFWKEYQPRAPIVVKINAIAFLEGFRWLIGQSPPPIRLQVNHLAHVAEPPPSHTLNTNFTLDELF